MMNYVLSPNLPQNNVDIIICGTNDKAILDFFSEKNIKILPIERNEKIDPSVSLHVDMAVIHLGGNKIIVDKLQSTLKYALSNTGFTVYESEEPITGNYPDDIKLNYCVIGDYIVGKLKSVDKMLLKLTENKTAIDVNQGYCRCSTLIINENAIITDDESIYKKTTENGFKALLISKGDIALEGHSYGFIGGASGKISKDTVLFFGDILKHRDSVRIIDFLSDCGCSYVCTDNGPLRDIGGFIPVTEK